MIKELEIKELVIGPPIIFGPYVAIGPGPVGI